MGRAEDLFERLREGGKGAIDEMISAAASEELFLDFKQAATTTAKLHNDDKKNYAKALSGFANSEGGVIVWGVDARPDGERGDVAGAVKPIPDVGRFLSLLEGQTSGATSPGVPVVQHIAIPFEGRSGFVATLIRRSSLAPHRSLHDDHYYIRIGSSFGRAGDRVLRGMFGHPDPPIVVHQYVLAEAASISADRNTVQVSLGIQLISQGPGIARDVYLHLTTEAPKGGSSVAVESSDSNWLATSLWKQHFQYLLRNPLVPFARAQPVTLTFVLRAPFDSDIRLVLVYGHATSPTSEVDLIFTRERLSGLLQAVGMKLADGRQVANEFLTLLPGALAAQHLGPARA